MKQRLLGLDPGLRLTGWGMITAEGNNLSYLDHGTIRVPVHLPLYERLAYLSSKLDDVISSYAPDAAVVEEVFVNKNPLTTLKLGMARGVVLLAPARKGVPVYEYSANRIKKSVVGSGHADKSQVQQMVGVLLSCSHKVEEDAADALAAAICHSHFQGTVSLWESK